MLTLSRRRNYRNAYRKAAEGMATMPPPPMYPTPGALVAVELAKARYFRMQGRDKFWRQLAWNVVVSLKASRQPVPAHAAEELARSQPELADMARWKPKGRMAQVAELV